jgi:hypothetical protein
MKHVNWSDIYLTFEDFKKDFPKVAKFLEENKHNPCEKMIEDEKIKRLIEDFNNKIKDKL